MRKYLSVFMAGAALVFSPANAAEVFDVYAEGYGTLTTRPCLEASPECMPVESQSGPYSIWLTFPVDGLVNGSFGYDFAENDTGGGLYRREFISGFIDPIALTGSNLEYTGFTFPTDEERLEIQIPVFTVHRREVENPFLALRIHAVPEPATWAMMLLGFGAAGWSLRRRRRATPAAA